MAVRKPKKKKARARLLKAKTPGKRVVKKRKRPKAKAASRPKKEKIIGIITHYFPHVKAAVVKLKSGLSLGDSVRIKGHTTDFTEVINSMQIDHKPITKARKGQEIGLLVNSRVRHNDVLVKA